MAPRPVVGNHLDRTVETTRRPVDSAAVIRTVRHIACQPVGARG